MSAHWTVAMWECVFCKHREEHDLLEGMQTCSKCFSPMVVVRAEAAPPSGEKQ